MGYISAPAIFASSLATTGPIYSLEAASVKFEPTLEAKRAAPFGVYAQSILEHKLSLSLTPASQYTALYRALLFPHLNKIAGQSLFGASDATLTITGVDGEVHVIKRYGVTKMPDITLAPNKPLWGEMEIRGLCVTGGKPADADAYYTITTGGSFSPDTAFTEAQDVRASWLLNLGSVLTNVEAQEGWTITFEQESWDAVSAGVTRDVKHVSLSARIRGRPVGLDADDILAALKLQNDASVVPGRSTYALSEATTITDGTHTITVPKGALVTAGNAFATDQFRNDEIELVVSRNFTAGVQQALLSFA